MIVNETPIDSSKDLKTRVGCSLHNHIFELGVKGPQLLEGLFVRLASPDRHSAVAGFCRFQNNKGRRLMWSKEKQIGKCDCSLTNSIGERPGSICFSVETVERSYPEDLLAALEWFRRFGRRDIEDENKREYDAAYAPSLPSPPSPPKPPKPGYVYLMHSENGLHKIGASITPESRLKSLQREFPIQIKLVSYFWANDYMDTEADLHEIFKEFHLGNEWFDLPEWAVDYIKGITDEPF